MFLFWNTPFSSRGKPKVSKEELELEKKIAEALLLKNSEAAEDLTEKTESLMDSVGLLSEEPGKNQVVDSALGLIFCMQFYFFRYITVCDTTLPGA